MHKAHIRRRKTFVMQRAILCAALLGSVGLFGGCPYSGATIPAGRGPGVLCAGRQASLELGDL